MGIYFKNDRHEVTVKDLMEVLVKLDPNTVIDVSVDNQLYMPHVNHDPLFDFEYGKPHEIIVVHEKNHTPIVDDPPKKPTNLKDILRQMMDEELAHAILHGMKWTN